MDGVCRAFDLASLQTANAALIELIRERIHREGSVPFSWFMAQALYHPEHGYYSSGRCFIGRDGDYFTNVSVGPVFGQLMAAQFTEMWTALGEPAEFVVVEQGAHDGQFALDVLSAARERHARLFASLAYRIIEPAAKLQDLQRGTLSDFASRVSWRPSLDELEPFCGVYFSNELLDALPVELVVWSGSEWLERRVTLAGGEFAFTAFPVVNPELQERLRCSPDPRTALYETEVNLVAPKLINCVASKLRRGFVVTVDYGYARDEFYAPLRTTGTLQCRARHRLVPSALTEIGHADITAHVDWTAVAESAERAGLSLVGFTDQHHFITGMLASSAADNESTEILDSKKVRELQTLLHPGFLGMKFQFLLLGKAVDATVPLAGLRFARNARDALGLATAPTGHSH